MLVLLDVLVPQNIAIGRFDLELRGDVFKLLTSEILVELSMKFFEHSDIGFAPLIHAPLDNPEVAVSKLLLIFGLEFFGFHIDLCLRINWLKLPFVVDFPFYTAGREELVNLLGHLRPL